jgi:RNA polymerase sigma-70 factor, ECF subfamily
MFAMRFEEIAPIIGRSVAAARQTASRARRRVQGADDRGYVDRGRQRQVVEAFLAASGNGDFAALLAVFDPEVVRRADHVADQAGATAEVRGARSGAETF